MLSETTVFSLHFGALELLQSIAEAAAAGMGFPADAYAGEQEFLQAVPSALRRLGILLFAGSAAVQDFRHRGISVQTFAVFWGFGIALAVMDQSLQFTAFLPGLGLLILSGLSQGGVGSGDALYFLTAAWFLSFERLLWVLCAGLALSAVMGLFLFMLSGLNGRSRAGTGKYPLPFTAIVFPAVYAAVFL